MNEQQLEVLISGQIQISEPLYESLDRHSQEAFELVSQTKVHGIWVDGYMFNNRKTVRKIYRQILKP